MQPGHPLMAAPPPPPHGKGGGKRKSLIDQSSLDCR